MGVWEGKYPMLAGALEAADPQKPTFLKYNFHSSFQPKGGGVRTP